MNAKKKTVTTLEKRKPKGGSAKAIPQEQGTERSARQALHEKEQHLISIYEAAAEAMFYLSVEPGGQYRFDSVNPAFLNITGLTYAQLTGRRVSEVIPEPSLSLVLGKYSQAIRERTVVRWEEISDYPTGRLVGDVSVAPIFDEDGHCTHLVGSVHDITERKQVEEALRESEAKFRLSFMTGLDAVYIATLEEGLIIEANDNFEGVFGYSRTEAIGKTSLGLNLYYDPSDRLKMVWELKARGFIRDLELKGRKKSGEIITISISISVIQIKNKAHILGVIRDITERKQAQITQEAVYKIATAAETTGSLERLYPQIHQIISAVMPAENFYITLYDETEDVLRFVYFKDDADDSFKDGFLTGQGLTGYLLRSGKPLLCTPALLEKLEREHGFKLLGVPFAIWLGVPLMVDGKVIGALVIQDYSDPKAYGEREQHMLEFVSTQVAIVISRKRAEEALQNYSTRLEAEVDARTRELLDAQERLIRNEKLAVLGQLAGGVGHELRNPLGVINTSIYYLKMVQPDATEKVKRHHDIIEQEVRNADKIISDLLDFTRIKSVEQEPVSVKELVQRTLVRFPPPTQVQVTLALPTGLPEVYADPRQMEQVLGNLVTNGCQAMKDGGKLSVICEQFSEEGKKYVTIAVKDTGTGITPENMKKLFEPLFTTKAKGIGLGLAVSKKLAEANGGQIEVESEVGKGSTFTLVLPAVKP